MSARRIEKIKKTYETDIVFNDSNYNFTVEAYTMDGALVNSIRYLGKALGLKVNTDEYDTLVTAALDSNTKIKEVKKSLVTF